MDAPCAAGRDLHAARDHSSECHCIPVKRGRWASALPVFLIPYSLRQEATGCAASQVQGSGDTGVDCVCEPGADNKLPAWRILVGGSAISEQNGPLPPGWDPASTAGAARSPSPRPGLRSPGLPYSTPRGAVSTAGRKEWWPEPVKAPAG